MRRRVEKVSKGVMWKILERREVGVMFGMNEVSGEPGISREV